MKGWPECPTCHGTGANKCAELKPCLGCGKPQGVVATRNNDPGHTRCLLKDPKRRRFNPAAPHVAHGYNWGKA
jgi:hypothetical protein